MKNLLLLFVLFKFNLLFSQNFVWQKQFRNFGVLSFKNTAVATNSLGDIVTVGSAEGNGGQNFVDFNPSSAITTTLGFAFNKYNIYVSKLNYNGDYLWVNSFDVDAGISQSNISTKIDDAGNVYVIGLYMGLTDFDFGAGTFTMSTVVNGGGYSKNSFIAKINSDGTFGWAKEFKQLVSNNGSFSLIENLTLDNSNNLILTGTYNKVDFDPSPTATLSANNSGSFITKLDNNGDLIWSKQFVNNTPESPNAPSFKNITTDNNNNIITIGSFGGTVDFDMNSTSSYTVSAGISTSYFTLKLNSNGDFIWVKTINDNINLHTNADAGSVDIATDSQDNVIISGVTNDSLDFDPTLGTLYLKSKGLTDIYVVKYDASGNLAWTKMFGGNSTELTTSLAVDNNGHIYIETQFLSNDIDFDPSAQSTYTVQRMSQPSMAVNQLNTNGEFVNCFYFKSTDSNALNTIQDITCNKTTNEIILSGDYRTSGSTLYKIDFDPGAAEAFYTSTSSSVLDGFVVKLNSTSTTSIIKFLNNDENFNLYPNPASNHITILTNSIKKDLKIEIINNIGQIVLTKKTPPLDQLQIDIDHLQPGIYYIKVNDSIGKKFIKT